LSVTRAFPCARSVRRLGTGAGNLLGNLLCSLTGILDGGVILPRFLSVVNEVLAAINAVVAL
jgi:hypothetical protein